MKGIAHYATGLAVATFFPGILHGAVHNLGFGPLLCGFAGLLPDTLDFRLGRYLDRLDRVIDPAQRTTVAGHPDAQALAESIADALNEAWVSGKQVKVHLCTVQLGAYLWQRYHVAFRAAERQVVVRLGPVVTTGQVPVVGDGRTAGSGSAKRGRAGIPAPVLQTYEDETTVDIFDGPTFAFRRVGNALQILFLPWHRAWSHSLIMVLLVGLAGSLVAPLVGLAMALAALFHIVADQLGYMGTGLFYPFTGNRVPGLGWMHSGDAIPNFLTVWLSIAIAFLNLDRFSPEPAIPVLPYLLVVIALPCLSLLGVGAWIRHRSRRQAGAVLVAVEALDESNELDL